MTGIGGGERGGDAFERSAEHEDLIRLMREVGPAGGSVGGGGGGVVERTADDEDILRFIRGGHDGGSGGSGGEAPGRAGEATFETEEDAFDALMGIDACEFADNLGVGTDGYCSPRHSQGCR